MSHKVLIGFGEMMIAEEPAMRRQRGGVRRGKHELSITAPFRIAYEPHKRKTTLSSFSLTALIAASVKVSQPSPWCEPALWASTVSVALSRSTP